MQSSRAFWINPFRLPRLSQGSTRAGAFATTKTPNHEVRLRVSRLRRRKSGRLADSQNTLSKAVDMV